jgi:hypothetical protein
MSRKPPGEDEPDLFAMPSAESLFGTDPHILHRRGGPETSEDAAYGVDTGKLERMVFDAVSAYGTRGCIADDLLEDHPYLPYSSITARPSSLEAKNLIVRGPDKRTGKSGKDQFVMRKSAYADAILARSPPPRSRKRKATQ